MINDLEWSVSSLYKSFTKNKIKINANKCQLLLNIPTKVKIIIGKKEIEGSDNKKNVNHLCFTLKPRVNGRFHVVSK